ncbi:uncharacterized protein LOC117584295 isoform X1 [Drosophila guanche]|uniref:Uncharacterized protein n=2 Tax=Drosophila guanche TaxID=7266 RepID=A0A3B0JMI9_DROGU|nr:uncharacterized protein LOC117584295 isoform X1 [Drosophila guanche]SPP81542.1 Hypothetical predicted protein [Drosophila guanche]
MSGLTKFQDSEAWRQKLRDHLMADRTPQKATKMEPKEQRYSLDIDEDLKKLLEARKQNQEQKEAATTINMCEDTMYESMATNAAGHGDESFDVFERMCDKTASDPDSTLFQYMHSEDKNYVLAQAKENSGSRDHSGGEDTAQKEIEFLRRMLEQIGAEEHLDNESPLKGVECTQLEDVEAPSRFWDNDQTLAGGEDSKKNISPVKMVGLLRPSTIIEASELESDVSSEQTSFQSAQTLKTNASSSYETATESGCAIGGTLLNVDDLFYAAIEKAKPLNMSKEEKLELLGDLHCSLIELASPTKNDEEADDVENTIIELSSTEEEEEEEEKASTFDIKEEDADNKENSMHFNDTIEEMQYMMQKGMEYMAAAAPIVAPAKPKSPLLQKQNTFVMSPSKRLPKSAAAEFMQPALPLRASNKPPQSVKQSPSKSKIPSRYDINMDLPKTTFFGTPTGIPQRRQRQLKHPYDDIISPIRTYTQMSGTAPLMSTFRQTSTDVYSTLAISELEQESRLCHRMPPATATNASGSSKKLDIDSKARLLPKKAYISSELQHVIDERTPIPMPSVQKIQKYLNTAVEPKVFRHDGKMKMPSDAGAVSHIPRRANQSLADLSLASGDISMYTLRDAQKFTSK